MRTASLVVSLALILPHACPAQDAPGDIIRLGIIGLDTSHVPAFTQVINDPAKSSGCKVVAAYPGGSSDLPASADRVEEYTRQMREEFGAEIVDSIESLCEKVDGVLLESVDGRPHLAQVRPVIAARKPVYIDKPMAADLADVIAIFELARRNAVPCWSSSSLRFSPGIIGMRQDEKTGKILGCAAYSPCHLEEHHPDFYWYGVHGVEILYTLMGQGCETVSRIQTQDTDLAVGVWKDGRIGSYRGLRGGKQDYGALVFGSQRIVIAGPYTGYGPLCDEIIQFFKTGEVPVPQEETIELFAFMSAADLSKAKGGIPVLIDSVIEEAAKRAERLIRE